MRRPWSRRSGWTVCRSSLVCQKPIARRLIYWYDPRARPRGSLTPSAVSDSYVLPVPCAPALSRGRRSRRAAWDTARLATVYSPCAPSIGARDHGRDALMGDAPRPAQSASCATGLADKIVAQRSTSPVLLAKPSCHPTLVLQTGLSTTRTFIRSLLWLSSLLFFFFFFPFFLFFLFFFFSFFFFPFLLSVVFSVSSPSGFLFFFSLYLFSSSLSLFFISFFFVPVLVFYRFLFVLFLCSPFFFFFFPSARRYIPPPRTEIWGSHAISECASTSCCLNDGFIQGVHCQADHGQLAPREAYCVDRIAPPALRIGSGCRRFFCYRHVKNRCASSS